ncbi:L-threonylcarbamoyladenylate synthase [Catenovulum sp. 2E275]|uniref:L-threonylcarbamoyladenylate synthase n=1 Tax=Catenovulum sp. 2E275 TaxID=2980497 RepID=UPI0021D160BB|nr:L-threonylcarbamoyladenylate synthase [Catenovulum sp. 2E275]MCU4674789.1 L-threonylcarbamoyladenylate synthase [Catenovulum sp. 2E275]
MSQFFYVHPENPQKRLIQQACEIIKQGGVVVYPTDSGYAIGCQVGNKSALERICRIRQLELDHDFTLVCSELSELSTYARVENQTFRMLKNSVPGPYTFILKATREAPKLLQNKKKKTIGLRVPDNKITLDLLACLAEPIMSSTLILPGKEFAEADPEEIRDALEHQVDLIIHGGNLSETPTSVIDMSEDEVVVLREGNGDISAFV